MYNRGVDKRIIFADAQDYRVFLSYISVYLLPKDEFQLRGALADKYIPWAEKDKILKLLRLNNYSDSISLLAFCLMPNHFHFLLKQNDERVMNQFMKSLCTRYSLYIQKKYKRVGPLLQGVYKAVPIKGDEQMLQASRYIHRNPRPLLQVLNLQALEQYPYSSYYQYLNNSGPAWVKPEEILKFFSQSNLLHSYRNFVEMIDDEESAIITSTFAIEEEP